MTHVEERRAQCPGVYLGNPVPGGYKYGDLALQVGGVSNETVKYGREFCGTSTALARPRSNCTVSCRPVLSSGRALQGGKPANLWGGFQGEGKVGRGSRMGARRLDGLAD
jgi:hypothetical protein